MTVITERDLKFLETLGDYEMMTTSQITRRVFSEIDKKTVLRRLRKLEREKLIKRTHGLASGELVWSLSQFGAYKIQRDSFLEKINRNCLEHDTTLTELRLVLERFGMVSSWRTEQSMRRQMPKTRDRFAQDLCPDAIVAVKTPNGYEGVGLELEFSPKNASRYAKVFAAYGERRKYFAIWYVVESESLGKMLEREWAKANSYVAKPQFGWMLLRELLKEPHNANLFTGGKKIKLSSVIDVPLLHRSREPAPTPAEQVGNEPLKNANEIAAGRSQTNLVPLPHSP